MSRTTRDQFDSAGQLVNGFDYDLQCWVKAGRVLGCGHPQTFEGCGCAGRRNEGDRITDARKKEGLEEVSGVYHGMKEHGAL